MRLLISFAALFLSVVFVQLSSGAMGPLDALSGVMLGFSAGQIGALGSAHFFGFFIGCWWAPRLIGSVGPSRAFAAFAACGTLGALGHTLTDVAEAWMALRVLSGIAVAGAYTVVESWLQAKVTNANRGRVLGVYRVVDILAGLGAQLMIGFLEPAAYVSYNILAIFACLCLLPITLTKTAPPASGTAPRLRPMFAFRLSPLGAAGVFVSGITMSAFRMAGPLYGTEQGLRNDQIGLFLAAGLLGGALAQVPTGWLADKIDRRHVLIGMSAAALIVSGAIGAGLFGFAGGLYLSILLFGFASFPLFSVSSAHANDFCPEGSVVELNASLMFTYSVGAIASPYLASVLIGGFGPRALFIYIAAAHVALILFSLWRMRARPAPMAKTPYTYRPRTSFILQRLFRK
jgi:MFS family permease